MATYLSFVVHNYDIYLQGIALHVTTGNQVIQHNLDEHLSHKMGR